MSKAKTEAKELDERLSEARAQWAALEKRILELSRELASMPQKISALDWADEEKAILALHDHERRQAGLPHLIRHLKLQACDAEIAVLSVEMEQAEEKRPELRERVEKTVQAHKEAQAAMLKAQA